MVTYYLIEASPEGEPHRVYLGRNNKTLDSMRELLPPYREAYPENKFWIEKETTVITTEKLEF